MYFGVDYYPEHWPEERWSIDAKMMREAHINIVRLAEFAWAKMEPEEGTYDFSWLDRSIEVFSSEKIKVVLGTPTAAAPKWLMDKHPDMYPKDVYGLSKGFGTRRHYCLNHPVYRDYSKKIARAMAAHFKGNENIVAWQIDNEFGGACYCQSDLHAFRIWLRKKYGTLDKLNQEWGTIFWSQTYRTWEEIILPVYSSSDGFSQSGDGSNRMLTPFNHNPGLQLDYQRFFSDSTADYQRLQIEEIRAFSSLPITHNLMGHFNELDYYDLGKDLDFISWDNYPNNMWAKSKPTNTAMAHDLMRGIKNSSFWMMEQQSGPCGWHSMGDTPEPGQVRLWTYQAIAHGAEAMVYFRWRACTVGIEQYWHGILDHDGLGRRRYREVKQIGQELMKLSSLFEDAKNASPVALIKSYDNVWSHRAQPHNHKFTYGGLLDSYYKAVTNQHIGMDVTSVENDFTPYKLVIMPAFNLMTEEISDKCKTYVKNGGSLLITFRSGTRTWNNQITTLTFPGLFRELAGVELEEFDSINFGRTVTIDGSFGEGTSSTWCDVLRLTGAEALADYDSHYYKGTPAVTVNTFGKGRVYYVACDLNDEAMSNLMGLIVQREKISTSLPKSYEGVEAIERSKDGQSYLMVLNHHNAEVKVELNGSYRDALSETDVHNQIVLAPYAAHVLVKI